jgi:hypothetical protein
MDDTFQPGHIVQNLIPAEPVTLTKVQDLGSMVSLKYTGNNSQKVGTRVVKKVTIEELEIVTEEGMFTFTGNPEKFKLYAEAGRIRSAYLFDPLFAVICSIIDPLPHQVEVVYKYFLPLPNIRFLLADGTGAGEF